MTMTLNTQNTVKTKTKAVVPNSYSIEFNLIPIKESKLTLIKGLSTKNIAQLLVAHADIVAESRNLIKQGKIITWDEYLSKNKGKAKHK